MRSLFYIIFIGVFVTPGCKKQQEKEKAVPYGDIDYARHYGYIGRWDSALYYYTRVISNSKDSLEKGEAYLEIGQWELNTGDYLSAQESLLSCIRSLDQNDTAHHGTIAACSNSLANATLELKDYESAILNYRFSFKYTSNRDYQLGIWNNLGMTYQRMGNYEKAIAVFDSAAAQPTMDTLLKARIISNLARTKWLADSSFVPLPEYMTALTLRKLAKDPLAINASLAHLSEYYTNSRPDSALYYALKRFEVAQTLEDPSDRLEALEQLVKVSLPDETKKYTGQYISLNDSLSDARSRIRNQYPLIKFGVEKSKADNLLLQRHIVKQRLVIWGTVLFAVVVILALVYRARARRIRLKREAESAIRESQLRTSQKVHDVVANGLYRVMNELEHIDTIDKESLINRIEQLYEKSRDISYEQTRLNTDGFHQQIHQLVTSFANDQTKVIIIGDQKQFWSKVSAAQKQELQLVIEEMMVNMKKHSHAKNVVVQVSDKMGMGHIDYKDDGVGFRPEIKFGNGLNNTVCRIKKLNGEVIFDKNKEGGTSVSISFPLELL